MRNLRIPRAGENLSASWARDVVEELRALRLSVLPPLALDRTPDGSSLRLRMPAASATVPRAAFDIKDLTTTSITVTRCWYMRQSVAVFSADEPSATLSGTEIIVSAKINKATGAVTLEAGEAPYDTVPNKTAEYLRRPLYHLMRADASAGWVVYDDFRSMLAIGLYE